MNSRPVWLDEYACIIDDVRSRITHLTVMEEVTFRYAIIRLFARATLAMYEIYTLLDKGYPEGAFALSRQIYETILIMEYVIIHKNDKAMIERCFDDIEITKIKILKQIEESSQIESISYAEVELNKFAEKYRDFYDKDKGFTDYWWVKKNGTFSNIAKKTQFPKCHMYKETSSIIHMSLFNSTTYLGNNQNQILIGETYDGIEKAGWYSMLCFCISMSMFSKIWGVEFSDIISKSKELTTNIRKQSIIDSH